SIFRFSVSAPSRSRTAPETRIQLPPARPRRSSPIPRSTAAPARPRTPSGTSYARSRTTACSPSKTGESKREAKSQAKDRSPAGRKGAGASPRRGGSEEAPGLLGRLRGDTTKARNDRRRAQAEGPQVERGRAQPPREVP